MKPGQDVDEWLLSGLSENCSYTTNKHANSVILPKENEDEIILKKIEENQIK